MESTVDNPLAFFEDFIDNKKIYNRIQEHYKGYDSHYSIQDNYVFYVVGPDNNNVYSEIKQSFEEILTPYLKRECQKSKQLMIKFCNENEHPQNYLQIQFNTIQDIFNTRHELLNKYPFFIFALRGILKNMNTKLSFSDTLFELNEEKITIGFISDDLDGISNEKLIHNIFDYMRGVNEKGEEILNKEDYNLLLQYTIELVSEEKVPVVTKKIQPKITKDLIRFTYWVLHKKLYTTKKIRPYFYDFIKAVFIDFNSDKIDYIKNQFGTKSRVTKDSFIPEIIAEYLH